MKFFLTAILTISFMLLGLRTNFGQTVTLQWDPSPDPAVVGYNLYYGVESQLYTNVISAGASGTVAVGDLVPGVIYFFSATALNWAGMESPYSGEVSYLIGSPPCSIIVSGLVQTYDGTPKGVSVTTVPPGLPYLVTYAGLFAPPVYPGSYPIAIVIADPIYATADTETLTITPPTAAIQLDNLNQQYDGTPKSVLVTTEPPNLAVTVTYNGMIDLPINAGTYEVTAIVDDPVYTAVATATLTVAPVAAAIQFTDLSQIFDGTPKPVTATTDPPGLNVVLTYNGQTQPPTAVGIYTVLGVIRDTNYFGSVMNLLTVAGVGPTAPLQPLGPSGLVNGGVAQAKGTGSTLLLSWANTAAGVTLWQSSDLIVWTPFANLAGTSSPVTIVPQTGPRFFRATRSGTGDTLALPLSISTRPAQPVQPSL